MNLPANSAVAGLLLLGLCGCVPFDVPRTPAATGFGVDSVSGQPISGARVFFKKSSDQKVVTKADGYFQIPPRYERHWLPPLPYDFAAVHGIMIIEAPGYVRLVFDQKLDRWPPWSSDKHGFLWALKPESNQVSEPSMSQSAAHKQ